MILTLSTTTAPSRDLGYLLRKHPDRLQTFELPFGSAHVFYPEATDDRCTAALVLDIDPVGLVRGKPTSSDGGVVESYVNDRPYAVTSFMSVAIARVFTQALAGKSDRPELTSRPLDLEAVITPVHVEDGEFVRRLFDPLGYVVESEPVSVPDEARAGAYRRIAIRATTTVRELLTHLYVLVPVMDRQKHYWVGDAEVEKLFRHGADWLATHPEREAITRRYLERAPGLARVALARLATLDEGEPSTTGAPHIAGEASLERPLRLQDRRIEAVVRTLRDVGATSIADLGCGDGDLIAAVAREPSVTRIVGADVSVRELERAKERLARVPMATSKREAIQLLQSSLLYYDRRLTGFDAATLLEVIEHVDAERLPMLERIVFGELRPRVAIVTTPNCEYNVLFTALPTGRFRHTDHRFEWTRAEFASWTRAVGDRYGYAVDLGEIGDVDATHGAPTQIAVFRCA